MNLPNALTILRIAMVPVFMLCRGSELPDVRAAALIVFALAAITDRLDGYIARKQNIITSFGKIMDPLADKLLVFSALIMLLAEGRINQYALMIILARELAVSSLRAVAGGSGVIVAAGVTGKIKTVIQIFFILFMLLDAERFIPGAETMQIVFLWVTTAFTLYSGIDYFVRLRGVLTQGIKNTKE